MVASRPSASASLRQISHYASALCVRQDGAQQRASASSDVSLNSRRKMAFSVCVCVCVFNLFPSGGSQQRESAMTFKTNANVAVLAEPKSLVTVRRSCCQFASLFVFYV